MLLVLLLLWLSSCSQPVTSSELGLFGGQGIRGKWPSYITKLIRWKIVRFEFLPYTEAHANLIVDVGASWKVYFVRFWLPYVARWFNSSHVEKVNSY